MSTENQGAKALAHLRLSNEIASRFQDQLQKQAAARDAVMAKLPAAVKSLVDNERIFANQSDELTEKLANDPVAAIELIRDLAKHRNANELDSIGSSGRSEKQASAQRTLTGGPIPDYDETESGQAFRQRLFGASA